MTHEQRRAGRKDVVRNRQAILDSALEVLSVRPRASMADIARDAGLTRGTLYRHFPTREALLVAARDTALEAAAQALASCDLDAAAPTALADVVRNLLPLGVRFRALLVAGADHDEGFTTRRLEILAPVHDVIVRGQGAGEIRPEVAAAWVLSVLVAQLVTAVRMVDAGQLTTDEAATAVTTTLLAGVASPPADR